MLSGKRPFRPSSTVSLTILVRTPSDSLEGVDSFNRLTERFDPLYSLMLSLSVNPLSIIADAIRPKKRNRNSPIEKPRSFSSCDASGFPSSVPVSATAFALNPAIVEPVNNAPTNTVIIFFCI